MCKGLKLAGSVVLCLMSFVGTWSFGPVAGKSNSAQKPKTHVVTIKDFRFFPENLTVNAGDSIVWRNEDRAPHTATAQNAFDSGTIAYGKDWTLVTKGKGTFEYICTLHPRMRGTLVVQ